MRRSCGEAFLVAALSYEHSILGHLQQHYMRITDATIPDLQSSLSASRMGKYIDIFLGFSGPEVTKENKLNMGFNRSYNLESVSLGQVVPLWGRQVFGVVRPMSNMCCVFLIKGRTRHHLFGSQGHRVLI